MTQTKQELHAERDKTMPIQWFYGKVVKHIYEKTGITSYHLWNDGGVKYDLPMELRGGTSMEQYKNKYVRVRGRVFEKTIGDKMFKKILLIYITEV